MLSSEVEKVVKQAKSIGIPLLDFVEEVTEVYVQGGVTGFKFFPKNYDNFKSLVQSEEMRTKIGIDSDGGSIGNVMGSDARRHGYSISARQYSAGSSLHLELKNGLCDAHVDSRGITPGDHDRVPLWGDRYDPVRLIPHGINDLLPSILGDSFVGDSFVVKSMVNPVLGRLSVEMRYKGNDLITDGRYPGASPVLGGSWQAMKPANQFMFNLTFGKK